MRKPTFERLDQRLMLFAVPVLQSHPGAEHTIFLDFDGHNVRNSTWNSEFETIHAPAFDLDGDSTHLSSAEQERIVRIWGQMAEDFRPFDVNVTTVDPTIAAPDVFSEPGRAQRIMFSSKFDAGPGGTGLQWFTSNAPQGFAIGDSWFLEFDNPVWVFATHPNAGTIGSHEFGHAIGLSHDGETLEDGTVNEYRGRHGQGQTAWSPIMGFGSSALSQWSQGEYANATNQENDLGLLTYVLGKLPDDFTAPTPLAQTEGSILQEGIINDRTDRDIFRLDVKTNARVNLRVDPWEHGPNLDIGISLWGPSALRFSHLDTDVNPVDRLDSSFDMQLEAGTYFLTVQGVGKPATSSDEGYSDYASLGYYKISGTISTGPEIPRGDLNSDGQLDAADIDALLSLMRITSDGTLFPPADLNDDAVLDDADLDVLVRDLLQTDYGDFDLDGTVGFSDFLILSGTFGQSETNWSRGDADGDRDTDFADFLILAAHFGKTRGAN